MVTNINQPHILKAIEYCLNNNIDVTYPLLTLVDNTYKDEASKGITDKIKDVIQSLESSIEKVKEILKSFNTNSSLDIRKSDYDAIIAKVEELKQ